MSKANLGARAVRHATARTDAPLYKEVRRTILQCLAKGEWAPGEQLPTEPELAARFGVAVPTVRAGVRDLVAEGVLIRRQGKGTFVARHDAHPQHFRFSNIYNSHESNISTIRTQVTMERVKADPETAHLLGLDFRDPGMVYRIGAVLAAEGGAPVAVMELILPLPLFKRLRREDLEQSKDNLYSVYQRLCGVTVLRMEERVYARAADRMVAKALHVPLGHPILLVDRLAFTFDDQPVEIRRRSFEGLKHHYLFTHNPLD